VIAWQFARQQSSFDRSYSLSRQPERGLPRSQRADYVSQSRPSDSKALVHRVESAVYPYSVIRGGVANPAELKYVMEYDPVVSRHFHGFDYRHAHLVKVTAEQAMYVSYRIGDSVYWTRRQVKLHPGETLITDGTIVARTRCGNRVARVPLEPGSPLEPSPDDLDRPFLLRDPVPTAPTAATVAPVPAPPADVPVAKNGGWWFIPPPVFVSPGSSGGPLAVTPEPGSILLISSGLAAVYWRSRKNRKKK
jgi:PEP-CTERM motif-containing protein